jgi:hypothetical protein
LIDASTEYFFDGASPSVHAIYCRKQAVKGHANNVRKVFISDWDGSEAGASLAIRN